MEETDDRIQLTRKNPLYDNDKKFVKRKGWVRKVRNVEGLFL